MLALCFELPNGLFEEHSGPNWPPNPGPLLEALLPETPEEEAVAAWLQGLPPPAITADPDAPARAPIRPLSSEVPLGRLLAPSAPIFSPSPPRFYLVWAGVRVAAAHRAPLHALLARGALGLTAIWSEQAPPPTFVPGAPRELSLTSHGHLAPYHRIESAPEEAARGHFSDEWLLFRHVSGPAFDQRRAVDVAARFRAALLKGADLAGLDARAPILSGHHPDGAALAAPHLAVVPLPSVGHRFADGRLLGVALVLPTTATPGERALVAEAVEILESETLEGTVNLFFGHLGVLALEEEPVLASAKAAWCRPACQFMTATPIALDHNPGNLASLKPETAEAARQRAAEIIARAVERQGLPRPQSVDVRLGPPLTGGARAVDFGPFPRNGHGHQRALAHAVLTFARPIAGPLLLGAGRYLGLGLLRPLG